MSNTPDNLNQQLAKARAFGDRLISLVKNGWTLPPGYDSAGYNNAVSEVFGHVQRASKKGPGTVRQQMEDFLKQSEERFEQANFSLPLFAAGIGAVGAILVWTQLDAGPSARAAYRPFETEIPYERLEVSPV